MVTKVDLSSGHKIPKLGLGTWLVRVRIPQAFKNISDIISSIAYNFMKLIFQLILSNNFYLTIDYIYHWLNKKIPIMPPTKNI